jgi:transposase
VLVNPSKVTVVTEMISGLPVVNSVLARIDFDTLVKDALGDPDPRSRLAPACAIGVLVRNLALGRQPLYGLSDWAGCYDEALFGLRAGESLFLNDDKVGRSLDELFVADRASLSTRLSLAAVSSYRISLDELHNDSTSISLYGAYRSAKSPARGGRVPAMPARGHSKDHRPDLKQLVWILTVSADGAVPVTYKLADGNTEDSTTHVATWEEVRKIAGRPDFLYVADCKLATRDNMDYIAGHAGRFLSVLPRTRREDATGRAWLARAPVAFEEVRRQPGRHKGDPDDVYWAAPAPTPSDEGYRIVWVRSSTKRANDAAARADRIELARAGLDELAGKLGAKYCRLKSATAVEDAAEAVLEATGARPWVRYQVTEAIVADHRQERRGRPGPNTSYRRVEHKRFSLTWWVDSEAVVTDAASDGCFPLVTNDTSMTPSELLAAYKAQPHLERRHGVLKSVIAAAPITLKSDCRIDAFGFCLYAALLVHALIELKLRRAMAARSIAALPLYPEERPCHAPTASRVLELLEPLSRSVVIHDDKVLAVTAPTLNPLQQRLLRLLDVPLTEYTTTW